MPNVGTSRADPQWGRNSLGKQRPESATAMAATAGSVEARPLPALLQPPALSDSDLQARPSLRDVVIRTITSITVACGIPYVLFSVAMVAFSVSAAIIVVLSWVAVVIAWRSVTHRAMSGLLALTVAVMAVRTGFTLATGNTFVYFVQPVFANAAVAALFLGSLCTARPAVAWIAADFYPMDDQLAARPNVRRLFRRLTLMWGLVTLIKGSVTLWLLESQSIVDFVLLKNIAILTITTLTVAATIWLSAAVAAKEGILRQT
jgi:hypothetical protein